MPDQPKKIGEVEFSGTAKASQTGSIDTAGAGLEMSKIEPQTEEEKRAVYDKKIANQIAGSRPPAMPLKPEKTNPEQTPKQAQSPEAPTPSSLNQDNSYQGPGLQRPAEESELPDPPTDDAAVAPEERVTQLNWQGKIQKAFVDRKNAFNAWREKNLNLNGAKAAGKWLLMLFKNPYVLAALVISFLIIILFVSCSKLPGKTPYQKPDLVKDKPNVLEVLAATKDPAAQREIIFNKINDLKKTLAGLSSTNADAQKKIDQIKQLLDEMSGLSESPEALKAKINQIFALIDQIKALAPELTTALDAFKVQLQALLALFDYYEDAHLILNPIDMEYIRNFDVDRRIIIMLAYLVRPVDLGGAGHERIKVKRIKFSYDTERKSPSKETDYAENEEPNVSAHFTGQAADIVEIDCIKCTEIKRRRALSDKKTKLEPIPIKVAWQTSEGFAKAGGPEVFGQNMHQVFGNLGSGAVSDLLAQQISDMLGIDIDPAKLEGRAFGEIVQYIGIAVLKQTLDIPGDYELGNDFSEIVRNAGLAYIAQAINVPIEGLKGSNEAEIMANIGRALTEEKMQLPTGSLQGNSSAEVFTLVGQRKIEETLRISRGSMSIGFSNANSFKQAVGQGRVEKSLGLNPLTFYGGSIDEVKTRIGKDSYDTTFASASAIDQWLGIPTGSAERLLGGSLSPNDFNVLVGNKVFTDEIEIYTKEEKRAEAYGIALDELRKLQNGDRNVFVSIGKNTISQTLTVNTEEQTLLMSWFNSNNLPPTLDADYLANQYGLKDGDLEKIFLANLSKQVFERIGRVEVLLKLENDPNLNPYFATTQEIRFYTDRFNIIKDNVDYIGSHTTDPEIRQKAEETKALINQIFTNFDLKSARSKLTQIQTNIKFIEEKSTDSDTKNRVKIINQAINEIIEGRPMTDFSDLSADSINARTNPQTNLTKKDILDLLLGRKTIEEVAFQVGTRKWELELDLPDGSLKNVYDELKANGFKDADSIVLSGIGKARLAEYDGLSWKTSEQIDRDLGLTNGTTADYRFGRLTEKAYHQKIGMAYARVSVANRLLNPMLELDNTPYALTDMDITKLLNGGWFYVALKIGGSAVDKALDFPVGGTMDIIQQVDQPGANAEDVLRMLAEVKLGIMAGLNHPVSIDGDITYNLGLSKIEQELGLQYGTLNDTNVVEKIRTETNSNKNNLSQMDAILGLKGETSQKLLDGSVSAHDYIKQVGDNIRNTAIYDQIARSNPILQNQELRTALLTLANGTGTPQEILEAAGAQRISIILGLDYPVSIRGNFKDNLGQGKIETRLGLKPGSFKGNIDEIVIANSQDRFEAAFYIRNGQLANARIANSGYWTEDNINQAKLVDITLNIPSGMTKDFLTGSIDVGSYIDAVGQSTIAEVTVEKLADYMGLDDEYKDAANQIVDIINQDKSFSDPNTQKSLFRMLVSLTGQDLDNKTQFDPGTWENILFTDPAHPDTTGIKNADHIILEQGKKWMPRWLGMDPKYDPYMDIIYEKGLAMYQGTNPEAAMINDIRKITGIPNDADAARLLHGDVRGGLTAWGAGLLTKKYNEAFEGTGATLNYETVMLAYANDLGREQAIGDAAVAAAQAEFSNTHPGVSITADYAQGVREEAIRQSRNNARKSLMYAAVDMQLHHLDNDIPAGFTQTMREGTSEQRWSMGVQYLGNMVHSNNPSIPAELLPNLQRYFFSDPNSPDYHNPDVISSSAYGALDTLMKDKLGDFIQPGTAQALFVASKNGWDLNAGGEASLANIYTNYGINIVCNWADKQMGLPSGSTKLIYDGFVTYQNALQSYHTAWSAYLNAGTANEAVLGPLREKAFAAKTNMDAMAAAGVTFILTTIFQDQLADVDQSLGLVPGSSAMLVGMGVSVLMGVPIDPWTIGLFVLTNLFGTYRIDIVCTACGYYPSIDPPKSCPLGEFDGANQTIFREHSVEAAQYKVRQLLTDIYNMPKALNDDNQIPTQIMTLRQEDVDYFATQLNEYYGAPATRGNSGLWANDLMWDHLHVGY